METVVVILVLFVLLALFGGAGYLFVRETGWDNARLWLTSPGRMRQGSIDQAASEPLPDSSRTPHPRSSGQGAPPLALDETALRNLREELQGELARAAGVTRDFDARLTRIEADVSTARHLPDVIASSVQKTEARTRKRLEKLRVELQAVRKLENPFGQRRVDALARLYGQLAQVEAALAAVINPMLLPGEPLKVPDELYDDTLEWSNWGDVGERAYSFGEAFNQTRFVLEPELADHIESFIGTFRQALTDTVYPIVQNQARTPAQVSQMRTGLMMIAQALPPVRREIEMAYRTTSVVSARDDDDDDDDDEPDA